MMHSLKLISLKPRHPNDSDIDSTLGSRKNNFTIFSRTLCMAALENVYVIENRKEVDFKSIVHVYGLRASSALASSTATEAFSAKASAPIRFAHRWVTGAPPTMVLNRSLRPAFFNSSTSLR